MYWLVVFVVTPPLFPSLFLSFFSLFRPLLPLLDMLPTLSHPFSPMIGPGPAPLGSMPRPAAITSVPLSSASGAPLVLPPLSEDLLEMAGTCMRDPQLATQPPLIPGPGVPDWLAPACGGG